MPPHDGQDRKWYCSLSKIWYHQVNGWYYRDHTMLNVAGMQSSGRFMTMGLHV